MDEETKAHSGLRWSRWGGRGRVRAQVSLTAKPLLLTPGLYSLCSGSPFISEAVIECVCGSHILSGSLVSKSVIIGHSLAEST